MTCEFDLVADSGQLNFVELGWEKARFQLLELQPAARVTLVGDPPSRLRVTSCGDVPEVAPGLLAVVEALVGTSLSVEVR